MTVILPVAAIIPTRDRSLPLMSTLQSLAQQSAQPIEAVVVDASTDDQTQQLCQAPEIPGLVTKIVYHRATTVGAATQRNQAIAYTTQSTILFCDDDILFEPDCLAKLWAALQCDPELGGVNAMITNQRYLPPGRFSRMLFQFLDGKKQVSYAGQCIGPGLNLLPEDRADLPEVVPVQWLNTTCTLYRRQALPHPPFPEHFTGYSLMEDLTLSLTVGQRWKLANARTARIFHDSQPGSHKNNPTVLSKMELVNRHYVMTQILQQRQPQNYLKLMVLQGFGILAALQTLQGWKNFPAIVQGNLEALAQIVSSGYPAFSLKDRLGKRLKGNNASNH
ncbi:MAG: glycosyltransferase family 2 protein [Scytolyngbya sp. HA4215-MV1]|jgi:glycosyltransferase involved in cell wall biosynthesis|nr:glycosyltransferase family 2 protein [Scytolyngbya sp. HA4215-MV1]